MLALRGGVALLKIRISKKISGFGNLLYVGGINGQGSESVNTIYSIDCEYDKYGTIMPVLVLVGEPD